MAQQEIHEQSRQIANISINELILLQLRDLKESDRELRTELKDTRRELNARIDKLDTRIDKLDARFGKVDERIDKLDERISKLDEKIDGLRRDMTTSTNHGQIANISTIGIALAVIYSLLR